MIDFFDPKKNPFISMMNPQGSDGAQEGQSAGGWSPMQLFWPFSGMDKRNKPELPKMPEELWKVVLKYGNQLIGLPTGRKSYDFDFED